jgi:muramoyltetrapeptide carboxypeptidase
VCAPSGPVDPDRLHAGVAVLEELGFEVRVGDGLLSRARLTAGSVDRRVQELHGLFEDASVAAIFCARGGEGAGWLLPHLDPSRLLAHPKALVGYSDATFLHLLLDRLGIVSFHGPMVSVDFPGARFDAPSFWGALRGDALYQTSLEVLRPGTAEGRLRGGCLSILASAAGTRFSLLPQDETILFLEDVGEPPYQVDRMLFQLRESGALEGVSGVVFGEMKGCTPPEDASFTLREVLEDALSSLDVPVAFGLPSGHTTQATVTVPLGVRVRLTCADGARLEVLEEAVR